MSTNIVRRGFVPTDEKEFGEKSLQKLREAQKDVFMLINRGYPIKSASTFVGNHYLLSERQRMAVVRSTSDSLAIQRRLEKEKISAEGETVQIDGFNIIITLEVALSHSTLIKCMDGTIRDLAGLRGTYKIIDKTDMALKMIGESLEALKVKKAVFYIDKPVSNSGRLKSKILDMLEKYDFEVECELVDNADKALEDKNHPVIQGILKYLSSGKDFDGHVWLNTIKSNNDYPHAEWWSYNASQEISYNPTACLLGFILKYDSADSELYALACSLTKEAYEYFKKEFPMESMHTVSCFVELYEYMK